MANEIKTFLLQAATQLRELAERAPDIGSELRRFADGLEQLAARDAHRKDGESLQF